MMQVKKLHSSFDKLHSRYGNRSLCSIYGAGCTKKPVAMFIFMNPTGRNISSYSGWIGIRAPWLGTKNIWKLFHKLGVLSDDGFRKTQGLRPDEWSPSFALSVYKELADKGIYITNLAKCTQIDARPMNNSVFKEYLELMFKEIALIQPRNIFAFGNQVSSILLQKQVSVGGYNRAKKEIIDVDGKKFPVYPIHYPVGQGMRNMPLAIKRIAAVI